MLGREMAHKIMVRWFCVATFWCGEIITVCQRNGEKTRGVFMTQTKIVVALAGNPNSGKTTIFNRLTGARQHVGNYPGVTVEKKAGVSRHKGVGIIVVDLPGTYSLSAYSIDERVARNIRVDEKPDVVIHVVDASNMERNLYLAVQIMELGVPLVVALNMSDVARARGIEFNLEKLSRLLGAPVVPTVGHKGPGIAELLDVVVAVALVFAGRSFYWLPAACSAW